MSNTIPILINHDAEKQIGWVSPDENALHVEFWAGHELTKEQFFQVFGNCGVLLVEAIETPQGALIRAAKIKQFSLPTSEPKL